MEQQDHFDQAEPAEVSWEKNAGRWGRKLGFILAVWSFLALIPAAQTYLYRAGLGHPIPWHEALLISFVNHWIWAALTPGVLWLSDRYPIERRGWRRVLLIYSLGAITFAVLHAAIRLPLYPARDLERLVIRSAGRVVFLRTEDVDWFEGCANYVRVHVGRESHLMREKIGALETRLDPKKFVRVHRSSIVRIGLIKELRSCPDGEYAVILQDGSRLRLSRGYRAHFRKVFQELV